MGIPSLKNIVSLIMICDAKSENQAYGANNNFKKSTKKAAF